MKQKWPVTSWDCHGVIAYIILTVTLKIYLHKAKADKYEMFTNANAEGGNSKTTLCKLFYR